MADLDRLAVELRALGRQLDIPPVPDVTVAVRARLATPAPRRRRVLRYALVVLLVLLSIVFGVPPVRAAVVDFFRIGGVSVRSDPGPPLPPTPALTSRPVADLAEAERVTGLRVRPPAALGRPDSVLVVEERVVSLAWRATAAHPEVRMDAFDGRPEPVFEKYLRFRDAVEVDVGGVPGWYVRYPHAVVYVDPDGFRRTASARLAGPTLIWVRGPVTYRLEADLPADRLTALAAST